MAIFENPYTAGYEAAYQEVYAILNDEPHQVHCGECRPCGLIKQVVEILMETLASRMTQEEFFSLAFILARTGHTAIDSQGYVRMDWWGRMNDATSEDDIHG